MMTNGETVTDTETPQAKPSKWDRLMAFLDSLGSTDEAEVAEAAEVETDAEAAEVETDAEAAEVETDDAEVETGVEAAEVETDTEVDADAEVTPGSAAPNEAADADLRAKLTEQAATIETYRNMLAAQGLDPATAEAIIEVDAVADTPTEDERIAAFDEDYAVQEAKLAEIKMES